MTQRKISVFDKLGTLIPGYRGYAIRDEKRNDDKKIRDIIATKIQKAETDIIRLQQLLIRKNEIQLSQEWEFIRKALNTLMSKIKNAAYGESSFFSDDQIRETELDQICQIDLELAEKVDGCLSEVAKHLDEMEVPVSCLTQINYFEELIQKRSLFIKNFK